MTHDAIVHRQRRLRRRPRPGDRRPPRRALRRRRHRRRHRARARRRRDRGGGWQRRRPAAPPDRRRRRRRHHQRRGVSAGRHRHRRSACCRSARSTTSPRTSAFRSTCERRRASLAGAHAAQVDVGEVNGRIFLNNSSLGLYPDIVRDREQQQQRLGPRQVAGARLGVAGGAARAIRSSASRSTSTARRLLRRTPFVFIGNNEYLMEGFAIGERARARRRPAEPLRGAARRAAAACCASRLRALLGRLAQARDFDVVLTARHRSMRTPHRAPAGRDRRRSRR